MSNMFGSTKWRTRLGVLAVAIFTCLLAHNAALAANWPQPPTTATAAETWVLIDKDLAELETLIQAGKIGHLGAPAYGVANAFKTLSEQSASLPPDKLAEVQGDVKIVGGAVTKLDKAGEHNDAAGVQSNLQVLKATLTKVRAYYPH
jgi:hypothetical protein